MSQTPKFVPATFDEIESGDVVRITTPGQKRRQTVRVHKVMPSTILPCFYAYRVKFDRGLGAFVSYGMDHAAIVYPSSSLEVVR